MSAFNSLPVHHPSTVTRCARVKAVGIEYNSSSNDAPEEEPSNLHEEANAGDLKWTRVLTALTLDADRTTMIVRVLLAIPTPKRKVLVVSHRIEHLKAIFRELSLARMQAGDAWEGGARCRKDYREYTHGMYTASSMTREQRQEVADECDIILASSVIAQVEINIPRLDTLVFATPHSKTRSIVQNILRMHVDKSDPLVIDIIDGNSFCKKKFSRGRLLSKYEKVCGVYDYPRQWDSVKNLLQ